MNFSEPKITFDAQIIRFELNKIYNIEPTTIKEKEMFVKGFFLGDGSSGIYKYKSKIKYCWHLNNSDYNIIEKLQRYCKEIWNENFKIYDIRESSHIYRISSGTKKMAIEFNNFYTKYKEKRIPDYILNESIENRKWFLIGFYSARWI